MKARKESAAWRKDQPRVPAARSGGSTLFGTLGGLTDAE
jgi:hypothetical protein